MNEGLSAPIYTEKDETEQEPGATTEAQQDEDNDQNNEDEGEGEGENEGKNEDEDEDENEKFREPQNQHINELSAIIEAGTDTGEYRTAKTEQEEENYDKELREDVVYNERLPTAVSARTENLKT